MDFKTKEPNYLYAVPTNDNRKIVYCVGNITGAMPFICKGTTRYITPFYLDDGLNVGATSQKAVIFKGKNEVEYATPHVDVQLKNLRIPTLAINISQSKYSKVLEYLPELGDVPKQIKEHGVTVFLPIIAFDEDAIFLHQNVLKGDSVLAIGELKRTEIKALNRKVLALWCNDVRKIKTARRNLDGEEVDC